MNVQEYYAPLQAWALAQLGYVDLTTTGVIDITEEHDPVGGAVLEDAHVG